MLQHAGASTDPAKDASPVSDFSGLSAQWRPLRDKVERFIEQRIYPLERSLDDVDNDTYFAIMRPLMAEAKAAALARPGATRVRSHVPSAGHSTGKSIAILPQQSHHALRD